MSQKILEDTRARAPGEARCPDEPSTQEIIARDKVAAPGWVRSESYKFLGDEDISIDRYIDPAFAKKEFDSSGPAPGSSPAARNISRK